METTSLSISSPPRLAYTVKEAGDAIGKNRVWVYRRIYDGLIKVCQPELKNAAGKMTAGEILIPASELHKLLANPTTYTPRKNTGRGRPPKKRPSSQLTNKKGENKR
jgi:hypothetical protein